MATASSSLSATAAALATFQRLSPETQAWPSAPPRRVSAAGAASAAFREVASEAGSTRASSGDCTPLREPTIKPHQAEQMIFGAEVARQVEQYRGDALEASNYELEKCLADAELSLGDKDRVIESLRATLKAKDNLIAALDNNT